MSHPPTSLPTSTRDHLLLGIRLRSDWPLPCPVARRPGRVDVELFETTDSFLSDAREAAEPVARPEDWFRHVLLPDGSDYLRWTDLFEFLVSPDGTRIAGRPLARATAESFQTYLLNQVLSFALLKRGAEPIHATAVVVDGSAVAFAAGPGTGKSTLGAAFLQRGYRLLTDDLLVLREEGGEFVAQPSMPRIKLFPEIARRLLGEGATGVPMNEDTPKLVISLGPDRVCAGSTPLRTIFMLAASEKPARVSIRRMKERRAFLAITRNTFNPVVAGQQRLLQHFDLATRVAAAIPVKSLTYPRRLEELPQVVDAIQADLAR